MSPRKSVISLTVLSYSALGHYLRTYVRVISSRSYNLTLSHKPHSENKISESEEGLIRNGNQKAEPIRRNTSRSHDSPEESHSLQRISSLRRLKYEAPVEDYVPSTSSQGAANIEACEGVIDEAIKKLHELTFNSLPWYCHQRLAEVFLQVLGESAAACRLLYRKWEEAHLYLHHVQVKEEMFNKYLLQVLINYIIC